jgi:hypothetical protein
LGRDPLRFFWLTIGLFFVVGLFMPGTAAGISDPGARMLQVSMWSAVCVLATRRRWIRGTLSWCAITLIVLNFYQMVVVAERPPMNGKADGPLPAELREFDHVEYSAKNGYYDKIDQGRMDPLIFPTAMFINRPKP